MERDSQPLADAAPELDRILTRGGGEGSPLFTVAEIECRSTKVAMRDGVRLATDIYLPPTRPAPVVAVRTPYGRAGDRYVGAFLALARRGYAVVSQDCRGTGDSEPEHWDYYMYESQDGYDLVDWITAQSWFGEFLGALGASYIGQTQWCMALHPRMSTIVPEVGGLGIAVNTAHSYMFLNAYARSVGKGAHKVSVPYTELERLMHDETLAGGFFNAPLHEPLPESVLTRYPELRALPPGRAKRRLWEHYCMLSCEQRARFVKDALGTNIVSILDVERLSALFGQEISHDAHSLPHASPRQLCRQFHAPALMITGWYDWGLNDTLATWQLLTSAAEESVRVRTRLLITPSAHNVPGYHEGIEKHPELQHNHRTAAHVGLLLHWYAAVRAGTTQSWPPVIYYLMGANEWRTASAWPPADAQQTTLYLASGGALTSDAPEHDCAPDRYVYDPDDPSPTVGGSIVSYVYPPGSVDVSEVQRRRDTVTYTTAPLEHDFDVVGPLRLILYASSTALDTDFAARLSDVFPDGRAIQLQSGFLRARYRNLDNDPEPLQPGCIYRFEIDMWATANRFRAGHRLRLDLCSADFPRFDRNSNRGGEPGEPIAAEQSIYHDPEHPSRLLLTAHDAERDAAESHGRP